MITQCTDHIISRPYNFANLCVLGNPRNISLPKGTTLLGLLELFQDVISKLDEFKSWKSLNVAFAQL